MGAVGTESHSSHWGNYSYLSCLTAGTRTTPGSTGERELFTVFTARLTPGYWKTHSAQQTAAAADPAWELVLSGTEFYWVQHLAKATAVFNAMNCGNSDTNSKSAVGCLAGHLLDESGTWQTGRIHAWPLRRLSRMRMRS